MGLFDISHIFEFSHGIAKSGAAGLKDGVDAQNFRRNGFGFNDIVVDDGL
jgi:hypothetical protein